MGSFSSLNSLLLTMIQVQSFVCNSFGENTYILSDDSKAAVIVDPGMMNAFEQDTIVQYIKDNGLTLERLLNTHCHLDHILGNKFIFDNYGLLPECHAGEVDLLQAASGYAAAWGVPYEMSPMPENLLPSTGTVSFGNSTLELIFAPGHSPAHLCFYSKEDNFLIGGDVLFYRSIGRTDLPGGDHELLLENIRTKLFTLPEECVVFPGHGQPTRIGDEIYKNPFLT